MKQGLAESLGGRVAMVQRRSFIGTVSVIALLTTWVVLLQVMHVG